MKKFFGNLGLSLFVLTVGYLSYTVGNGSATNIILGICGGSLVLSLFLHVLLNKL